jgi:hypothetical protein
MEKIRVKLLQQRGRSMRIERLVKMGGRRHSCWKNRVRFCFVCVFFLVSCNAPCYMWLRVVFIVQKFRSPKQTQTLSFFQKKIKIKKSKELKIFRWSFSNWKSGEKGKNHIIVSGFLQVDKSHLQLKSIPDLTSNFYPLWN